LAIANGADGNIGRRGENKGVYLGSSGTMSTSTMLITSHRQISYLRKFQKEHKRSTLFSLAQKKESINADTQIYILLPKPNKCKTKMQKQKPHNNTPISQPLLSQLVVIPTQNKPAEVQKSGYLSLYFHPYLN